LELQPIIEYSHRLVASALVGPLVLATCVWAWVAHRRERWLVVPATVALILLIAQALLGGVTVLQELPGGIVAAHLALAQALLATLIILLVVSYNGPLTMSGFSGSGGQDMAPRLRRFPVMILAAALMVYALLLTGSYVTAAGATAACGGWPLCHGSVFPSNGAEMIHMGHRYATLVFGLFTLYVLHLAIRPSPGTDSGTHLSRIGVRWLAMLGAAVLVIQIAAGAATVMSGYIPELRALHLSLATALWGTMAGLAALAHTRQNSKPLEPVNG
jgi:heme A synthase